MTIEQTIRYNSSYPVRSWVVLLLIPLAVIATACAVPNALSSQPTLTQSTSPLIPDKNALLADNRWRIVEIVQHGDAIVFDTLGLVYVTFHKSGQLEFNAPECNGGGYQIIAESEHHYRLVEAGTSARDCGERKNRQYSAVVQAIGATTMYELQDKRLFLIGPDVRIVLEIDNPY